MLGFLAGLLVYLAPLALAWKKNSPGCNASPGDCGCGDCTICSDDFNRSDGTDIDTGSACGWTEQSGSWAIASNTLQCISAGIATCDTDYATGPWIISVDAKHDTSGGQIGLIVGWASSSDYIYVRFQFSGASGTAQIRKVVGGVDSQVGGTATVTLNTNTFYSLKVCVDGDIRVSGYVNGTAVIYSAPLGISGTIEGLRAIGSGTATFDNWAFSKSQYNLGDADNCQECERCNWCSNGTPNQLQIVLDGFTDIFGCGCDQANGTYVLDAKTSSGTACEWLISLSNTTDCTAPGLNPGIWQVVAVLRKPGAPALWRLEVFMGWGPSADQLLFAVEFHDAPLDCTSWSALDLPLGGSNSVFCALQSGLTCKVTAL